MISIFAYECIEWYTHGASIMSSFDLISVIRKNTIRRIGRCPRVFHNYLLKKVHICYHFVLRLRWPQKGYSNCRSIRDLTGVLPRHPKGSAFRRSNDHSFQKCFKQNVTLELLIDGCGVTFYPDVVLFSTCSALSVSDRPTSDTVSIIFQKRLLRSGCFCVLAIWVHLYSTPVAESNRNQDTRELQTYFKK